MENWVNIESFLKQVLETVGSQLDAESIGSIKHYIDQDEYEMAFEILFTEIMAIKSQVNIDLENSLQIGKELNLHRETTFDVGFWSRFEIFVQAHDNPHDN